MTGVASDLPDASTGEVWAESLPPTTMWVLCGQLTVQVALFFGFGVLALPAPNLVAGSTLALGVTTVLLAPHGRIGEIRLHLAPLALMWWWALSLLWTADPRYWWVDTTANLSIVGTVLVTAGMLPTTRLVGALLTFFHLAIAFQVVWVATHPTQATVYRDLFTGEVAAGWRGSFIHKNALGPFLVVALLTVVVLERRRALRWWSATIAVGLLVMTQSVTAWWVATVCGGLLAWLSWYAKTPTRTRAGVALPSLVIGGLAFAGLARVYPVVVDAYGKDLTFTGRTEIWRAALESIADRPLTGYGVGGVWFRPIEEPARSIIADAGFTIFHTHNGYLELLLLLGAVGLALWLWLACGAGRAAWRALDTDRLLAMWGLTATTAVLLVSIAEVLVFGAWLALLVVVQVLLRRRVEPTAHAARGAR